MQSKFIDACKGVRRGDAPSQDFLLSDLIKFINGNLATSTTTEAYLALYNPRKIHKRSSMVIGDGNILETLTGAIYTFNDSSRSLNLKNDVLDKKTFDEFWVLPMSVDEPYMVIFKINDIANYTGKSICKFDIIIRGISSKYFEYCDDTIKDIDIKFEILLYREFLMIPQISNVGIFVQKILVELMERNGVKIL